MTVSRLILVTGATGYVGGRLVARLLDAGYRVRCLVRNPARVQGHSWARRVEVRVSDLTDSDRIAESMRDVSVAYYLVHATQGGKVSATHDMAMARRFGEAADTANIERIIYLGELVDPTTNLSPYLRGRHEVGAILRHSSVPVTEFRAGMIVGSGSVLFEMVRYLTERDPFLICPAWYFSEAQPIAIRDVLAYLIAALETPDSIGKMIEIGGSTRLTYANMLLGYAHETGLTRWLIRTPFYAPLLSAYWVHMVTPIHWRIVAPLIEGLRASLIVRDEAAKKLFPGIEPMDFHTAVHLAVARTQSDNVETSWTDALVTGLGNVEPYVFTVAEGMFMERRQLLLDLPAETVFRSYTGVGGARGWLYMDWAWALRGWMDKAIGGVGLRRGRRHPDDIRPGESLDFWRVEVVDTDRLMRLRAEMRLPGKAWLEFQSQPSSEGGHEDSSTLLTVAAYFEPHGLPGVLYWYAMFPFHKFIFKGLTLGLASRARVLSHGD